MRSFRQKVILSYLLLLLVFLGLLYPSISNSVQRVVFQSMNDCADALVAEIADAQNDEDIVQILKDQKGQQFYRVGVLDGQRRLLYDSHTKRLLGAPFFPLQFITHPEIEDALQYGIGYAEEYSHLMGQKLVYLAKRFDFHGQPYVIRVAFPFRYIQDLRGGFTMNFLLFGSLGLILFSALALLVLNHFSSPIRTITGAIKNYKEGNLDTLPNVTLKLSPRDEFSHLANTLNSLSHRVRLEIESVIRERNEREAILESLSEGVVAVDSHFRISYANQRALLFLGLRNDVIGQPLSKELNPKYQRLLEKCSSLNRAVVDEIEVKKANDHQYFDIVATPRNLGGGALLVLHDTSAKHRMLDMRKAFIANASHELKTPITVIRGFAETLHDNGGLPRQTVEEVTIRIVANCQKMTQTIKNLLTLADFENLPSFHVAPHDLLDLVQTCAAAMHAIKPEAKISIQGEPCIAEVDSSLMEMAVFNLLDNGVKYSESPADIDVRVRKEGPWTIIDVQDHGIGIPETDLAHIFQRFYRVDKAHSTKLGGSGLGLSIVETIINKHLGKIEVRSSLGKGSTFSIFLPENLGEKLKALEEP